MPAQGRTSPASTSVRLDDSEASKSDGNRDEYVSVDLSDIRKDVQCPICLGIIRKTRTVMECLHRFCRECIDKSMRLGNNECPVCRTHCASRRSLRDDLNFDALIAALYPNLDSYEEEELALREEDKCRNRQLQDSIAETSLRQSDAIARRCTTAKVTAAAIVRKAHSKLRNIQNRNRGRDQEHDHSYSDPEEHDDHFPSEYEQVVSLEDAPREKRLGRRKRKAPNYLIETSVRMDGTSDDEQVEVRHKKGWQRADERSREELRRDPSSANAGHRKRFVTWARAGARSQMRYNSLANSRHVQCMRATVLLESISAAAQLEKETEFNVQFTLQPTNQMDNEEKLPDLEKPYLCCPANVTVQHICKFLVSHLSSAPTKELELLVGNEYAQHKLSLEGTPDPILMGLACNSGMDGSKPLEILDPQATLGQIHSSFWECNGNLVLMYRLKH